MGIEATAGLGGWGHPHGTNGQAAEFAAIRGNHGQACPDVPQRNVFNGILRQYDPDGYELRASVTNVNDLVSFPYQSKAAPAQVSGPKAMPGQRMCVTLDGSRLFLANDQVGVQVWDNPVAGVDATPDFSLTPDGPSHSEAWGLSCWLNEDSDVLYGMFMNTNPPTSHICGWRNASQLHANRAADFSFTVPSNNRGFYITGGDIHNVLFLSENIISAVYVIVNPSNRSGAITPDRTITATRSNQGGIAYDDTRDLLYTYCTTSNAIRVVTNAWQTDGAPTYHEFSDSRLGGNQGAVIGLQSVADNDLLFVGNKEGKLLVFKNASTLVGDVTADVAYEPDQLLENFAIWHQITP